MKTVLLLTAWLVALVDVSKADAEGKEWSGSHVDLPKGDGEGKEWLGSHVELPKGDAVGIEWLLSQVDVPKGAIDACSSKGGHAIGNECVFFSDKSDTIPWQDALQTCLDKYGTMSSPADPRALLSFLKNKYDGIPFWVGGYSSPYQRSFKWMNNTEIPLDSKDFPWGADQPPLGNILVPHQRCMVVNYAGGYAVQSCMNHLRYACTLNVCGALGGVTLGFQCLKFNEVPLNWKEADEACTSGGGRLMFPSYPELLLDYVKKHYNISKSTQFWVGGYQTDPKKKDPWGYWFNGEPIPIGAGNFPWAHGQPDNSGGKEHCLELKSSSDHEGYKYNDGNCDDKIKYICELETSQTQLPTPVQFVVPQISSGKYMGPKEVFYNIADNDNLELHSELDPNMFMAFDIVVGIWGYIRHVSSGKILAPYGGSMNPSDGTKVVLHSARRPWALFALDQYQDRIIHKSGKYIKPEGNFITVSGNESNNKTMKFQFMNTINHTIEVLPYGHPVVSGDWQLVYSVDNPLSTHTRLSKVIVGRSSSQSTSSAFKFGFESETKMGGSISAGAFGMGASASIDHTAKGSHSNELQLASSATWKNEDEKDHTFTVVAGISVAIWQRKYIMKQGENKAVFLSETFADTNSSSIKPNIFNGSKRLIVKK